VLPAITSPRSAASTWRARSFSACSISALNDCSTVSPASSSEARPRVSCVSSVRERDRAEARAARGIVGGDDLDAMRREALVAQQRARLARAVGFEDALVELALDVVGLVAEPGTCSPRSASRAGPSSSDVTPSRTQRSPSSRRRTMPCAPRARAARFLGGVVDQVAQRRRRP
jgi:hypothetical protein